VYLATATGGSDAETAKSGDGDPRHGAAGGPLRDPFVAREHLDQHGEAQERAPSSSQGAWEVAPWRPRPSAEGGCRTGGAEEEGRGDTRIPEGEDRSPSS